MVGWLMSFPLFFTLKILIHGQPRRRGSKTIERRNNSCNFRRKQTSGIQLKNDINYVHLDDPPYTHLSTMSESTTANESLAQKQARLRRERRNAKIAAGGSARLAAIMNSSGRQHAAEAETGRFRIRDLM